MSLIREKQRFHKENQEEKMKKEDEEKQVGAGRKKNVFNRRRGRIGR